MPEHCVGFFINPLKTEHAAAVRTAKETAEQAGYRCIVCNGMEELKSLGCAEREKVDFIAAFGGDGTILRAADWSMKKNIPILGVNLGRIGFLSEINIDEFAYALERILHHDYQEEQRMALECWLSNDEKICCLNDILLYKKTFSGVAEIMAEIDGEDAGTVFCDGLIISTPTGATGYSISAGGPVIAPGLDVSIITPICPHTLSFRPIIVSPSSEMRFVMKSIGSVSSDGVYMGDVSADQSIRIRRAEQSVKFIRLRKRNLYMLIRDKLA